MTSIDKTTQSLVDYLNNGDFNAFIQLYKATDKGINFYDNKETVNNCYNELVKNGDINGAKELLNACGLSKVLDKISFNEKTNLISQIEELDTISSVKTELEKGNVISLVNFLKKNPINSEVFKDLVNELDSCYEHALNNKHVGNHSFNSTRVVIGCSGVPISEGLAKKLFETYSTLPASDKEMIIHGINEVIDMTGFIPSNEVVSRVIDWAFMHSRIKTYNYHSGCRSYNYTLIEELSHIEDAVRLSKLASFRISDELKLKAFYNLFHDGNYTKLADNAISLSDLLEYKPGSDFFNKLGYSLERLCINDFESFKRLKEHFSVDFSSKFYESVYKYALENFDRGFEDKDKTLAALPKVVEFSNMSIPEKLLKDKYINLIKYCSFELLMRLESAVKLPKFKKEELEYAHTEFLCHVFGQSFTNNCVKRISWLEKRTNIKISEESFKKAYKHFFDESNLEDGLKKIRLLEEYSGYKADYRELI